MWSMVCQDLFFCRPWSLLGAHTDSLRFEPESFQSDGARKYGLSQHTHYIGVIKELETFMIIKKLEDIMVFPESKRPSIWVIFLYGARIVIWKSS